MVNNSDSEPVPEPGIPGALVRPRMSASRNVLNAALLRRPTAELRPVLADLGAVVSSRERVAFQPELVFSKTMGWQSCPAATKAFSEVHVRET